jgi:hypothetical protein
MGQAFSGVAAVNQGPDGPPGNEYWQARINEPSWILRERLLNGDAAGVREILGMGVTAVIVNGDSDSFSEGIRSIFEWTQQGDHPPSLIGSMKNVDLSSVIWDDDGSNSAFHYLAMGRSRATYSESMVHYPTVGEHSSPGPEAANSRRERLELAYEILASGRAGASCLLAVNSRGATALHIAAAVGDMDMIHLLRSSAGDLADSLLYHRDNSGHVPTDVALLFGHARSAEAIAKPAIADGHARRRRTPPRPARPQPPS